MTIDLAGITDYLITQSLQIAILVAVIAAVSFALRNRSAHIRYLLWIVVIAKCLVPPLHVIPLAVLPEEGISEVAPISTDIEMLAAEPDVPELIAAESSKATLSLPETPPMLITEEASPRIAIEEWAGIGWIVVTGAFLIFNVLRALRANLWLWKRRKEVPAELRSDLKGLFADQGITNFPNVWLVDGFNQPFVWGWLRGSIYLPCDFLKMNQPKHQRSVLSHELSHVLRFDAAMNIVQVIVQSIFWFHPLVWWANRKMRQEREKCCDEMVIARLDALPRDYSTAILEVVAAKRESDRPVPSLAVASPVRNVEERIRTMMRPGKTFYKHPSVVVAMIVLALALITVPTALVLTVRAATEIDMVPPHRAASGGDITDVEQWLAQGGDVNVKDPAGKTLLRKALWGGSLDLIQLLQKHGADIDVEIQNDPSLVRQVATDGKHEVADELISRGADTSHVHVAAYLGKLDQVKKYIESGAHDVGEQWSVADKNRILMGGITGGHVDIIEYILDHGANIKRYGLLAIAVRANRKQILELLIDKGANPNPGGGWSPLHITVWLYPRLEMAKVLLSHGADPYKEKGKGAWNPMHYAIDNEQKDMVKLFLDHRRDTDLLPYAYYALKSTREDLLPLFEPYVEISPIHLSCFYGKLDDVRSYLGQGKDIDAQDIEGLSLLQCAVLGSQMEIVEYLIAQGCNVNSKASDGATALHCTANKEMIQKLITAGALVEAKDNDNCTPFFYSASGHNDFGAAQVLLKHGADINIQRKSDGATALHLAASRSPYRRMKSMAWLIAQGADVNIRRNDGLTPLGVAINRGRLDAVKYLLEHGADVNRRNKDGSTPLGVAMNSSRLDAVKYLLEHGADVNCYDKRGQTPLHYAAMRGIKEIVELALNKGADINGLDKYGWPPLSSAVLNNRKEMVEMLLEKDADITVQSSGGRTATGIAKERGHTEIVELLRKRAKQLDPKKEILTICDYAAIGDTGKIKSLIAAGQDVNSKSKRGAVALHWASWKGHREIAELLIQNGADVNIQNDSGTTPLWDACQQGKKEIVELLLANGAEINAKNNEGSTALDIASERKHTEIVELLQKHGAK